MSSLTELSPWTIKFEGVSEDMQIRITNNDIPLFNQGSYALKRLEELTGCTFKGITLVAVAKCNNLEEFLIIAFVSEEWVKKAVEADDARTKQLIPAEIERTDFEQGEIEHEKVVDKLSRVCDIKNLTEDQITTIVAEGDGNICIKLAFITSDMVCHINECGKADECVSNIRIARVVTFKCIHDDKEV